MINKLILIYPSLLFTSFSFLPGYVLVNLKATAFQVTGFTFLVVCMYVCIEALELFTKVKLQNQPPCAKESCGSRQREGLSENNVVMMD